MRKKTSCHITLRVLFKIMINIKQRDNHNYYLSFSELFYEQITANSGDKTVETMWCTINFKKWNKKLCTISLLCEFKLFWFRCINCKHKEGCAGFSGGTLVAPKILKFFYTKYFKFFYLINIKKYIINQW